MTVQRKEGMIFYRRLLLIYFKTSLQNLQKFQLKHKNPLQFIKAKA